MKSTISDEVKKEIINNLNIKIGCDLYNLMNASELEKDLLLKKKHLENSVHTASDVSDDAPNKLLSAIKKAELNIEQIEKIKDKKAEFEKKVESFLKKSEPFMTELNKRFSAIHRLESVLAYFQSYAKLEELSNQMKQCKDDEQLVALYGEMKEMCGLYEKPHWNSYIKDHLHYWHNVLKDGLTRHYEDVLKSLKWPFTSTPDNTPIPKEILHKFTNITRYLFLIQEPEDVANESVVSGDFTLEQDPCLPVRVLLRPLKKRFTFHFTMSRQTARIDRPEWFLTQTLTWIKDHQKFVLDNVQPIADKLEMKNVNAVEEFNIGLIALAAERLHTVISIYHTQGKGKVDDVDAAFAHAVDETLGFHKELVTLTGAEVNSVISVLTKAETFVKWLAVEKKYALSKMDETLDTEQWLEPVAAGVGSAVGSVVWVPRGADWFISLLKTIEDRYAILPQPGHRLQFLELQLELIEEWRIRLTQLLTAACGALKPDSFLVPGPQPIIAIVNTAQHARTVLLQWAHSLHYLQLHYYRRQFQHFTQQQHKDDSESSSTASTSSDDDDDDDDDESTDSDDDDEETNEGMSLSEVEVRAKKMAINKLSRQNSFFDTNLYDITAPIVNLAVAEPLIEEDMEEAGVFADAPALFAHLRDTGIAALAEHILLEFKATIRDYKKQKWHAMLPLEQAALSVSSALCGPLSALSARLAALADTLAPLLATQLRAHLAAHVDDFMFEEVVLQCWFNTGGTLQFTHDVKRNIVPVFAPPKKTAAEYNQLPKLLDACKLLNMDYDDAHRVRNQLTKQPDDGIESLVSFDITHIEANDALRILNQRSDLCKLNSPSSVMELF